MTGPPVGGKYNIHQGTAKAGVKMNGVHAALHLLPASRCPAYASGLSHKESPPLPAGFLF
jgi:hypothetical protein